MSDDIRFSVWTKPVPQGSFIARQFGNGPAFAVPSNDNELTKYRKAIGRHAEVAMTNHFGKWSLFAKNVAIEIEVVFYFVKPGSVPKTGKRARALPIVKPDVDKLARAICDALTGKCWEDDAQVTDLIARKRYGLDEGIDIIIRRAEEIAQPQELPLVVPSAPADDF